MYEKVRERMIGMHPICRCYKFANMNIGTPRLGSMTVLLNPLQRGPLAAGREILCRSIEARNSLANSCCHGDRALNSVTVGPSDLSRHYLTHSVMYYVYVYSCTLGYLFYAQYLTKVLPTTLRVCTTYPLGILLYFYKTD